MKGWLGLVLLVLGIVVAASFGARNGERHIAYRQAEAKVVAAEKVEAVIDEGRKLNDTLRAEGVKLDSMSMEEHLALIESDERLQDQVARTKEAVDGLKKWGMPDDGQPVGFLHMARAERRQIGLPEPRERLSAWFQVGGMGWLVGIVLIVVGALLARAQQREDNAGGPAGSAGAVDFDATMGETLLRLTNIRETIATLAMDDDAPQARAAIDALGSEVLDPLVEGRGQLIARHGLAGFAEYFGPFSAGERNVNRAWSALTDGHAVVARDALDAAMAAFEAARTSYAAVEGRG